MGFPLPGYREGYTTQPREILYAMEQQENLFKPGGILIDSELAYDGASDTPEVIRAGWPMAQIAASGKYVPWKRTVLNGAAAADTDLVVGDASAFKVGDTLTIGTTTPLTITDVNYETNTITVDTAVTEDDASDVFATDGTDVCVGFLYSTTRLTTEDGLSAQDKIGTLLVRGRLNRGMLLGDIDTLIATKDEHFLNDIQIWDGNIRQL